MSTKRIQILSQTEIEKIYSYPSFSFEEQVCFFNIDDSILDALKKFKTTETKICFLLMLAYFKAKTIFYNIDYDKSQRDIIYIINNFFPMEDFPEKYPGKSSITKIKKIIRLHASACNLKQQKNKLNSMLESLVKSNTIPTYLLKDMLNYLYQAKSPIPAYTTLQTLIGDALTREENRLIHIIKKHTTIEIDQLIENLLKLDSGIYNISAIKADPKGFNTHDVRDELEKYKMIRQIVEFAKIILPKLNISVVNRNYYGSLAIYYDAYKLRQLPKRKYQLYMICFVYNQSYNINNNIIDAFVHYVRLYDKKAEEKATKNLVRSKLALQSHQQKIADILDLFDNDQLNHYKFKSIKKKAFARMPLEEMRNLQKVLKNGALDKKTFIWQFHSENHQSTTINIRSLFAHIDFTCANNLDGLEKAVNFMKLAFKKNKSLTKFKKKEVPTQFIDDKIEKYIVCVTDGHERKAADPQLDMNRYEYYVYQQLEKGLRNGTTFSNHSVDYKSLESDLKLKEKSKIYDKFIKQSTIPLIENNIQSILDEHKNTLETLIEHVNHRIKSGENKFVKTKTVNGKTKIIVSYEKLDEEINDPFFDNHDQINIIDLLAFVDELCGYSKEFLHLKEYQSKKSHDYEYLLACILANATGLGVYKLSESSHLNYDKLKNIEQSRVRLEPLKLANKIICDAMKKLRIFKYYNIDNNIHGSSDGQKFDVRWETFKSRYLRKYFKEKGVSAYSMIINNIAVDSKIITGHESHYLFDIIFNNNSNIRPNIISTDTEGANQVNFVFLDLITVAYAPCYKSISKKLNTIYGFSNLKNYKSKNYSIKPAKKVNEARIIAEWPNILNIFASLLSGDTSQSTIVKKLSSHERNSDTKDALWEYNQILMSIYLLLYVDDLKFRQNVRQSLNRGEGYHQLRRAIANVGGGDFRGKNEMEIIGWNECARLVANAIIFYNAYLLSSILEIKEKMGDFEAVELLKKISPMAWRHINFLGMYDFSLKDAIDIKKLLSAMLKSFDNEWSKHNRK